MSSKHHLSEKPNAPLYFDFHIKNTNIIIEFDGKQHFKVGSRFAKTQEDLDKIQQRDRAKDEWCKQHGYRMVRIHHEDVENIREILLKESIINTTNR